MTCKDTLEFLSMSVVSKPSARLPLQRPARRLSKISSKRTDSMSKTIAIVGAGPVGLAAAAPALERGLEPIVLEAGDGAGHAVRQWSHVRMFSPWEYNIDKAAARLLARAGWNTPDP